MSDETEASVLGSLPHSRPQRRSDKRGARPAQDAAEKPGAKQTRKRAAEQIPAPAPEPEPEEPRRTTCAASLGDGAELVGTVVKAAAELAEIGLTIGARALRSALSRLPRP
jgi:hypothetical protein